MRELVCILNSSRDDHRLTTRNIRRRLEVDDERFIWFVVASLLGITLNFLRNTNPTLFL